MLSSNFRWTWPDASEELSKSWSSLFGVNTFLTLVALSLPFPLFLIALESLKALFWSSKHSIILNKCWLLDLLHIALLFDGAQEKFLLCSFKTLWALHSKFIRTKLNLNKSSHWFFLIDWLLLPLLLFDSTKIKQEHNVNKTILLPFLRALNKLTCRQGLL